MSKLVSMHDGFSSEKLRSNVKLIMHNIYMILRMERQGIVKFSNKLNMEGIQSIISQEGCNNIQ